jgi:hypothetical protein
VNVGILKDITHAASEQSQKCPITERAFRNLPPLEKKSPAAGINETVHNLKEGRFAAAIRTDDGKSFALGKTQADTG